MNGATSVSCRVVGVALLPGLVVVAMENPDRHGTGFRKRVSWKISTLSSWATLILVVTARMNDKLRVVLSTDSHLPGLAFAAGRVPPLLRWVAKTGEVG